MHRRVAPNDSTRIDTNKRQHTSANSKAKIPVSAIDSSSSDDDDDNLGEVVYDQLSSVKFLRNLTKITSKPSHNIHGIDADEEGIEFGVGLGVDNKHSSPTKSQKFRNDIDNDNDNSELFELLQSDDLDLDIVIGEGGHIVKNEQLKGRNQVVDGNNDDNGSDQEGDGADNGNETDESLSDFGGGDDVGDDGVPLEKFTAMQSRLFALVEKMKKHKAEYKELKKKSKTTELELEKSKETIKEMEKDYEALDEAMMVMSRNQVVGGGGGGGGGSSAAALEEQRRKQREEARKALFTSGGDDDEFGEIHTAEDQAWFKTFLLRAEQWINKKLPLAGDVRTVRGHFGASVASFFIFYRWIITTYIYSSILCVFFLIRHIFLLWYRIDPQEFQRMNGLLPMFMTFSSYNENEKYEYLGLILLIACASFFDALRKWIKEDNISKEMSSIEAEQENVKYARQFLCCWDNSLVRSTDVEDMQCTIGAEMVAMLSFEKERDNTQSRTFKERMILRLRRFVGTILYLCLLASGWAGIIYLTTASQQVGEKLIETVQADWVYLVSDSVVPGCVTVINSALPILIEKIVNLEKWDSEKMVIQQLLGRMYLAKILNVVIQAVSYSLLADPFLFTTDAEVPFVGLKFFQIRGNVEVPFKPDSYNCRIDQVGAGLVQLLTVDFVVSKIIMITLPYVNKLKARITKKDFKKDEFTVAKKMVNILYMQGLVFAALPYAPLFTVVILIFHFCTFKFEKYMLFKFGTKPKKEWKAQDAGSFFIKFYLITIVAIALTSCYFFLSNNTLAKNCNMQDDYLMICENSTAFGTTGGWTDGIGGTGGVSNITGVNGTTGCDVSDASPYKDYLANVNQLNSYPLFECKKACGPFQHEGSVYEMVESDVENFNALVYFIYQFFVNPMIVWFVVIFFWLKLSFTESTLFVTEGTMQEKDRAFESATQAQESKIRKLNKQVQNLERAAGVN